MAPLSRREIVTVSGALVLVCASASRARRREVGAAERQAFRLVNRAPGALLPPVWAVMQTGSLGSVWVAATALHRMGRRRPAVAVAGYGTAVWAGVKLVKPLIGRGRPTRHLADVRVRGAPAGGLGFPSGHAAVAMTLALLITARSGPGARCVGAAAAAVAGVARIYVGAHLPLDVVGGLGLGVAVGTVGAATAPRD